MEPCMLEVLQKALDDGILDLSQLQESIAMKKRKETLEKHPYSMWEGKNGKWYTYLPDEQKGRVLKKRQTKQEIENLVVEYWSNSAKDETIEEAFQEWNDYKLELNKISASTFTRNQQIFERHFQQLAKKKVCELTPMEIESFLEKEIAEKHLSAKAFSNLKGLTKGILKRAKKRGLISFNVENIFLEMDVSDRDFARTIKEDCQEIFDEEEMEKIEQYLIENLDIHNLGILLMFITGMRVGELAALKHGDWEEHSFRIRRTETRYRSEDGTYIYEVKEFPKTAAGVRTVVIPKAWFWIEEKIRSTNPNEEYIFVDAKGKRMTTNCFRRRLERVCNRLSIVKKSPHKIRKTYGSILLDNHVDNRLIMGQMGHTDIRCTETHYHRNRRSVQQKIQIVSAIPELSGVGTKQEQTF